MIRQFDVIVWDSCTDSVGLDEPFTPPFTDSALGWFYGNDFNKILEKCEAEWIVFTHRSVNIDRQFLNDLADCTSGFPMVDAFAPRIKVKEKLAFLSGFRLDAREGIAMLDENAKMRYVAAPHPLLAAFSRRIVQRTGAFDNSLCTTAQLVDYALRMLHAGGKMFSVPYLVASTQEPADVACPANDLAFALVKAFGYWKNRKFLLHHTGTWRTLWKRNKELEEKRDKAILLSKLNKDFLAGLY